MLKIMKSQNPIKKVNIVVLYSQSLFAAGIEARLMGANQFQITRVDTSDKKAIDYLGELRPDVIIVDLNDAEAMQDNVITQFLKGNNVSKIIGLDLNSNEISIWRKEKKLVFTGVDLISAIEKESVV